MKPKKAPKAVLLKKLIRRLIGFYYEKEGLQKNEERAQLKRLQKKIRPLRAVVKPEVLNLLKKFSPARAAIAEKVFVIVDKTLEPGEFANYLGNIDLSSREGLRFTPGGRLHLIHMGPLSRFTGSFELAQILAHEILGHAHENRRGKLAEISEGWLGSYSERPDPMHFCELFPVWLRSEYKAFCVENEFRSRAEREKWPAYLTYLKKIDARRKREKEFRAADFTLYDEFKKAKKTGQWTGFKLEIIRRYLLVRKEVLLSYLFCQISRHPHNLAYLEAYKKMDRLEKKEKRDLINAFADSFFGDLVTSGKPV